MLVAEHRIVSTVVLGSHSLDGISEIPKYADGVVTLVYGTYSIVTYEGVA